MKFITVIARRALRSVPILLKRLHKIARICKVGERVFIISARKALIAAVLVLVEPVLYRLFDVCDHNIRSIVRPVVMTRAPLDYVRYEIIGIYRPLMVYMIPSVAYRSVASRSCRMLRILRRKLQ